MKKFGVSMIGICVACAAVQAQAPYAPFTAKQAELGKAIKSLMPAALSALGLVRPGIVVRVR